MSVFRLFGFDQTGYKIAPTLNHWVKVSNYFKTPMSFIKYKLAAFYSFHKQQDLPALPEGCVDNPGILIGGKGYMFMRVHLKRRQLFNDVFTPGLWESFLSSILQSKKGMPRPTVSDVKDAELVAFNKLTSTVKSFDGLLTVELPNNTIMGVNKKHMINQIRRTVREIFHGRRFTLDDVIEPFFPSTSSNYINTRSLGGVVGVVMDHPDLLSGMKTSDSLFSFNIEDFGKIGESELTFNYMPLKLYFNELHKRIVQDALHEEPAAVPLGLAESLKVRVITKGPPLLYTALKPLQAFLLKCIQRFDTFTLTGQTVTEEYVNSVFAGRRGLQPQLEHYLSIDYSDATNEMFSWCSECVLDMLFEIGIISEPVHILAVRAMTKHILHYEGFGFKFEQEQTRGQLMGSILSFPILCIINAAICRSAIELDSDKRLSLKSCPMAINGDDGILLGSCKLINYWRTLGSICGLDASIGKVYSDPSFLNINSRTFNADSEGILRKVPFIHLGILNDVKRSGNPNNANNDGRFKSVGSLAHKLIEECHPALAERVLGAFIEKNHKFLTRLSVPWFLPEYLLGIGLPNVGKYTLNMQDASFIPFVQGWKRPVVPTSGWRCRKYAVERVRDYEDFGLKDLDPDSVDERVMIPLEKIYGLLSVEALFRVSSIKDLYSDDFDLSMRSAEKRYYRKLGSIWKEIRISYPYNGSQRIDVPHLLSTYLPPPSLGKTTFFYFDPSGYGGTEYSPLSRPVINWDDLPVDIYRPGYKPRPPRKRKVKAK
jgi:hypothetical protein